KLVSVHHEGDGLFRPDQRRGVDRGGARARAGAVPGHQLQLGLALPELPVAGNGPRAALAQSRRSIRRAAIELRARFLPGGRGGAKRDGQRIPRHDVREAGMSTPELAGRSDFAVISEIVQPKSRVLDLGCGEGELLAWLAKSKG